jgi:hypothetical protein
MKQLCTADDQNALIWILDKLANVCG